MEAPRFPAGPYEPPGEYELEPMLQRLAEVPRRATDAVTGLTEHELDQRYRNWTIRQIVHHLADSHLNCYVRFRWALTESEPAIKAYDETRWAELPDARTFPLTSSLQILTGVHARWTHLVRSIDRDQLQRGFFHPEMDRVISLHDALPSYVWHADHHLAQIAWVRTRTQDG